DFLTLQEERRPALLPLRPFVEHDDRIDQGVVELVERAVDRAARGNTVARLDDLLSFPGKNKVGKEERRMRVRSAAGEADRAGLPEGRLERLPFHGCTPLLQALDPLNV